MTPPPEPGRTRHDPAFPVRLVSALILGPASLALVWFGGTGFTLYVAAFAAAMGWEWVRMAHAGPPTRAFAIAATTCAVAVVLAASGQAAWAAGWTLAGAAGMMALSGAPMAVRARSAAGVIYVAASAGALAALRAGEGGLEALVYLLAVVWAADSFAYLAGTWIGGPKLWPQASPNKTWTGVIAALAAGAGAGAAAGAWLGAPVWPALGGALVLSVAAVAGDLLMSLSKRWFGVKDSGHIIPGHGGVLDRVDALMLAVLAAAALQWLTPETWP